jgi:hypothetical protein
MPDAPQQDPVLSDEAHLLAPVAGPGVGVYQKSHPRPQCATSLATRGATSPSFRPPAR